MGDARLRALAGSFEAFTQACPPPEGTPTVAELRRVSTGFGARRVRAQAIATQGDTEDEVGLTLAELAVAWGLASKAYELAAELLEALRVCQEPPEVRWLIETAAAFADQTSEVTHGPPTAVTIRQLGRHCETRAKDAEGALDAIPDSAYRRLVSEIMLAWRVAAAANAQLASVVGIVEQQRR